MVMQTKKVTLVALAFPHRDLSPALVGMVEFARQDKTIRETVTFILVQFQYRDDMDAVAEKLYTHSSDVYAFSCYVWNIEECLRLARLVKTRMPQAVVLFGGPEASGLADHLMAQHPFIDYIIKGEGEEPFKRFLLCLSGKRNLSDVPSLVYRDNGNLLQNPKNDLIDVATVPSPYFGKEYLDYLNQVKDPVTVTFETARGCPFSCRYCAWGTRQVRFRPLHQVLSDLKQALNHPSVARIYITDSNIFLNKQRGKTVLDFLLQNNHRKLPVIFEAYPELLDDETTELIARFGEDEFAFGLQSSSPAVLDSINRRFNPVRYRQNIMKLKEANRNLRVWFSLIVGLPGDCLATFKESLAFAVSMAPYSLYIHEFLCLPGSEFFDNQEKYGFLCQKEAPHKLLYHRTFGKKDYLTAKELGFYTSLFHYYPLIKEPLLALWQATGTNESVLLEYYERLIEFLRYKIDLTGGKDVKEVPSFLFDEYYQKITSNKVLTGRLEELFGRFYEMLKNEAASDAPVFGEELVC